ncbi:type IV pilus twitching motility protein PilT [Coraliomargarita parva]|uniref:type IV pilus twitching motility protein PilT n=1 Tax=Coraliomargarita parva TaxID=3014050 RepID=UPI0022B35068|nr:PilT/PilU family type 4a pilus ATPase [Coraliomargarita parva]
MNDLDTLLIEMLEKGGSDLHLTAGAPPKARIDGVIYSLREEAIRAEDLEAMLKEVTPPNRWESFLQTGDVDLAHEIPARARFRMNLFKNSWGIGTVLRQIPSRVQSIDELGLPKALKDVAMYPEGLVLVTGPTGSGKSTTLAGMINHINEKSAKQIITLEDPIEFTHDDKQSTVLHREIGDHTRNFEAGLRAAIRADPDVILIGEMRSMRTIRLALNCAAMGMLVFATLHTNGATKTIDRIIDAFPADEQNQTRTMLAESLRAIVSQQLCKGKDKGRVPAFEILLSHSSLPNCIRKNSLASISNIIDQNREDGMISLDAYLRDLVESGAISREEAYMKAQNKMQFADPE